MGEVTRASGSRRTGESSLLEIRRSVTVKIQASGIASIVEHRDTRVHETLLLLTANGGRGNVHTDDRSDHVGGRRVRLQRQYLLLCENTVVIILC